MHAMARPSEVRCTGATATPSSISSRLSPTLVLAPSLIAGTPLAIGVEVLLPRSSASGTVDEDSTLVRPTTYGNLGTSAKASAATVAHGTRIALLRFVGKGQVLVIVLAPP